jgi:hypothetical protein
MKATIDFDESLYRRLKVEAARRGTTIRELVAEGVRHVLGFPPALPRPDDGGAAPWIGTLSGYASHAEGEHDLSAMRRSIARRRTRT